MELPDPDPIMAATKESLRRLWREHILPLLLFSALGVSALLIAAIDSTRPSLYLGILLTGMLGVGGLLTILLAAIGSLVCLEALWLMPRAWRVQLAKRFPPLVIAGQWVAIIAMTVSMTNSAQSAVPVLSFLVGVGLATFRRQIIRTIRGERRSPLDGPIPSAIC